MDIISFPSDRLVIAVGVLRGLVVTPTAQQVRFLEVLAHLHGLSIDAAQVRPLPPSLATTTFRATHLRRRLVQLGTLFVLADERVRPESAYAVQSLAESAEIDEPGVQTLLWLAEGRIMRARLSLLRRILGRVLYDVKREQGLRGVLRLLMGMAGVARDKATAERYRELARFPQGSLGRALWEHYAAHRLQLPGTAGAVPERLLFHDIGHVLSGYGTEPEGEILQAAFQAGFVRRDGFAFLLFGIVQFHLGVRVTPVAAAECGLFDVEKVLTALARGAACRVDLSEQWRFWSVASLPLEELRRTLCIAPIRTETTLTGG